MKRICWLSVFDRSGERFSASHAHFRTGELEEAVQAALDALLWHQVSGFFRRLDLADRSARLMKQLERSAA